MAQKIKISTAAARYGRTTDALRAWITRWNSNHPDMPIRRHPGYVDASDLARAMDTWDRQHTPAMRIAEALSAASAKGRG